jgi:hypothetical protein
MVSFTPGRFAPGEKARSNHWIGGWMGPRVGLDAVEKEKSCTAGNRTRAVQLVMRCYTELSRLL